MDCTRFEERLDLLLAGELPVEERRAVERHLAACPRCSELHEIATGRLEILPDDQGEDLTSTILKATTGPACGSVEELLCSYVDGELPASRDELVLGHLEHCDDCAALARAIQMTSLDLSSMAEIKPDEAFVVDVLAATSERLSIEERLRRRVSDWWSRQVKRPRFAVEAAYSIAMLLVLIFGMPNSPLRDLAPNTSDLARVNPVYAAVDLWQGNQGSVDGVGKLGYGVWDRTGRPATQKTRQLWDEVRDSNDRVSGSFSLGWDYVRETARMAWKGEFVEAWRLLGEMKTQVGERLVGPEAENHPDGSEP